MRILLVSATPFEIAPTVDWLRSVATDTRQNVLIFPRCEVEIVFTGVGIMSTAFALGRRLADEPVHLAIQAGIGGALDKDLAIGQVVRIGSEVLGDLGAEDNDGNLLTVSDLGFPPGPPFTEQGKLVPPQPAPLPFTTVNGVTVHRTSGTAETIARLRKKFPEAQVESMEGAAFFYSCLCTRVPALQLRAISNYVEPRNREGWEIGKAIEGLNEGLRRVLEAFVGGGPPGPTAD